MSRWQMFVVLFVLYWVAQKSVDADPVAAPDSVAKRPVWYNGPISTSLVYQRSVNGGTQSESRAFPSPVFYASPKIITTPADKNASATTQEAPKTAQTFNVMKFLDNLKLLSEKYVNQNFIAKQLGDFYESEEDKTGDVERTEVGDVEVTNGINEGRKKFHHHGLIKFKTKGKKKLSKILYPIIVGLITAKSILIPLFFKAVVLLSKFSFFVSTLSFIISSILGIKVLLLSNNNSRRSNDNTRVEVVHVPLQQKYPTTYSSSSSGWIDRDSENKFIPITGNEGERIIYEKPYSEQEKGLEKDSYLPL